MTHNNYCEGLNKLKELDERETMSSDDITELRLIADLALHANQGDCPHYWAVYGSSGGSGETFMVDPVRPQRE